MDKKIIYRFTGEITVDGIFVINLTLSEETGNDITPIPELFRAGANEYTQQIGTREMLMSRDTLPRIVLEKMIKAVQEYANAQEGNNP